ncbi:MAG: HlyD family secretion protein [Bacteroidia bacterium]|nr:HlyD family secretion protein [Bacteroidia bacterium]
MRHNDIKKTYHAFRLIVIPDIVKRTNKILLYFLIFLLVLMFMPWTQNVDLKGSLTSFNPAERPQTIHSTIAGRIEKWYVREGQSVKKGDTIVYLSEIKEKFFDPQLLDRIKEQIIAKQSNLAAIRNKSEALKKQIQALTDAMNIKLQQGNIKIQQLKLKIAADSADFIASKKNYQIAKEQFDRQVQLFEQGLKSKTELEARELRFQEAQAKLISSENKFYATKNDYINAIVELNNIRADYLEKISKAESELNSTLAYYYEAEGEISRMNNEYSNMQIRSSFYYITAPRDGFIVKALKSGVGETIKEGDEIVSILPENPQLAVELYADPMDVVLLRPGDEVRIQFEGWPALVFSGWPGISFGTFEARIKVIDKVSTNGKFRILAVPGEGKGGKWPEFVRVGTLVKGWALLKNVPVWYEIWRKINGFPPEFTHDIPINKDDKK